MLPSWRARFCHRVERGVDYATTVEHIERISALILEICGGQAGPIDDQIVNLPKREPVRMRVARAARVLGIPLSHDVVADVFKRLGLTFSVDGDVFIVEPPSYRFDLEIEEDLIEEVARIYGFERIPAKPPVAESAMRPTDEARRTMHDVRHAVAALASSRQDRGSEPIHILSVDSPPYPDVPTDH